MADKVPSETSPLLQQSSDSVPLQLSHYTTDQHSRSTDLSNYRIRSISAPLHSQKEGGFDRCVGYAQGQQLDPEPDLDDISNLQESLIGNQCLDPNQCSVFYSPSSKKRSHSDPLPERPKHTAKMDAGILRALKTVKNNPYVQYVGLGLAGLVTQKEQNDEKTGAPLRKSKLQLVRISAAVCGIELCYAAETAFVSPILLKLGVPPSLMTMIWCLSPILGFFLVPVMGSLSDRCKFKLGRRRPFIILMSIGIIIGLGFVPNGETIGMWLGDSGNETVNAFIKDYSGDQMTSNTTEAPMPDFGISFSIPSEHFRGVIFTVLGVAMLDFNCDACQSPCRAYLLDVSVPEDHSTGLTMFTVMAGLGGTVGYIMGGIDWNSTSFGEALGGHIRVVFSIVLIAFIVCVISTLTSFREIPLSELSVTSEDIQKKKKKVGKSKYRKFTNEETSSDESGRDELEGIERGANTPSYGAISDAGKSSTRQNKLKQGTNLNGNHSTTNKVSESNQFIGASDEPDEGIVSRLNATANLDSGHSHRPQTQSSLADVESQSRNSGIKNSKILDTQQMSTHRSDQRLTVQNGFVPFPTSDSNNSEEIRNNGISRLNHNGFLHQSNGVTNIQGDEINPYTSNSSKPPDNGVTAVDDVVQNIEVSTDVTLRTYLRSIVHMPRSMWILCLSNLFCWMSLVCYSLYFTDFVGQSVFKGNPQAPTGSDLHNRYDDGVRLGSFGMALYSFACACYSLIIEKLVQRFRAKRVYVLGQLVFTVGMAIMAVSRTKVAVILLSPTAGIMYATLFTMPYLLVAHYHSRGLFSHGDNESNERKQVRGLGTDVAIISSMVFLAQFILSVVMGTVMTALNSTVTVVVASSILSFLGAITATQVTYLDL